MYISPTWTAGAVETGDALPRGQRRSRARDAFLDQRFARRLLRFPWTPELDDLDERKVNLNRRIGPILFNLVAVAPRASVLLDRVLLVDRFSINACHQRRQHCRCTRRKGLRAAARH
jgi:hypothetical protein